ncbi:FAD binding domain [Slackia heliotrinireducens]|uniref:FAD-dependent dehydrogenase n=1 Tax=Slackia heliotrinireducens (strain ATCC 29202 / DSM 20476 / NCTC 11029 / RHS 1) TaxID=471855 RepID=C7N4F2_SLAHD|nr:FAD-binding protein [Slackia heliotrinireducens]ACV21787.1 FAD-dependent dehydrogenase [Slackia heliotrinireducens DSM 20476]VEG99471.1 FAD binding domain [Slackia heliotrinireducens]
MSNTNYDILIISTGPAGIFTALNLVRSGSSARIAIVEKGLPIERRSCPKEKVGHCIGCNPCRITTGFSGAGAFSDGKLSLSYEMGGDLPQLIGENLAQDTINAVDRIYLEFGADEHVEGLEATEAVKEIRRRAIKAGLQLVDCPIRHLGTEKAQEIYRRIQTYLADAGVELLFESECRDLVIEGGVCRGALVRDRGGDEKRILAERTVVTTGRRGADWLERLCSEHGIEHVPGPVDVGVRVELRNEVMERVNNALYESKLIGYPDPFRNKVRTFCQNPGGFVSQENYDNGLAVVNGHSYKERKSPNTNLAILCSHNFREPFDQPIQYAQRIGELANMLGAGHILVQRFGDILDGKRTWPKELVRANVRPTLPDCVAGDITSALSYRTMTSIIAFMQAVDQAIPGFAAPETLLYAPELKLYSNRVKVSEKFATSMEGLYCLGDSSGWTRGLMMASVMGFLMGAYLAES